MLINKFLFILILSIKFSFSYADQMNIKKVIIKGEKRLSESFILKYLPDYQSTIINNDVLNKFTKDLYSTGMFSKISLNINDGILEINVEEYSVINEISFTGNDLLDDETLKTIISINTRDVFNKSILNDSIENIKTEYQKIGRYLAEVTIKKVEISEGRVNLIFEIIEGSLLVVKILISKEINFSNNELKSNISTKEDAWYKIFGSNKFIPERWSMIKKN